METTQNTEKPRSIKTGKPNLFESETCGRCGGTGHYSYNMMHGTMCYGCQGHGIRLTKRGQAAQNFYNKSLKIPAEDVKVGMLLFTDALPGFTRANFSKITEIGPDPLNEGMIRIHAENGGLHTFPGSPVRIGWSKEDKAAKRAAALKFQETLTKTGKPRKR